MTYPSDLNYAQTLLTLENGGKISSPVSIRAKPNLNKVLITRESTPLINLPLDTIKLNLEASHHSPNSIAGKKITQVPAAKKKNKFDTGVVTPELIEYYNKNLGDLEKKSIVLKLLDLMRGLGGLKDNTHFNIPEARLGLALLSGIEEDSIKSAALASLIQILRKDPITIESSGRLMELMSLMQEKIVPEYQQQQPIPYQIEFAKAYGAVAELILIHYGKKNLNGVTDDLKMKFIQATEGLKSLNRQNNPALSFYAKFALEGILRLKDNKQMFQSILGRFYHVIMAGAAIYFEDGQALTQELDLAFSGIHVNPKHRWYETTFLIRAMGKQALTNKKVLEGLLETIFKNQHLGWNFLYSAIPILSEIAIHGATEDIRKMALVGSEITHHNGLKAYSQYNKFDKHLSGWDLSPVWSRFARPKRKNRDDFVRTTCLENLINIGYNAPDKAVRELAREQVLICFKNEKHRIVKERYFDFIVDRTIPNKANNYSDWIYERNIYEPTTNLVISTKKLSKLDLNPNKDILEASLSITSSMITPNESTKIIEKAVINSPATLRPPRATNIKRHTLSAPLDKSDILNISSDKRRSLQRPMDSSRKLNVLETLPTTNILEIGPNIVADVKKALNTDNEESESLKIPVKTLSQKRPSLNLNRGDDQMTSQSWKPHIESDLKKHLTTETANEGLEGSLNSSTDGNGSFPRL